MGPGCMRACRASRTAMPTAQPALAPALARRRLLLRLLPSLPSLACAHAAAAPAKPVAARTIDIAAEDDWAPYSWRQADGSVAGLTPELVRAVLRTQGIAVRLHAMPFARCLDTARSGRVAGCFNTAVTLENRQLYAWHPTPLFHEEVAIFSHAGNRAQDLAEKNLEGHAVGITIGYVYGDDSVLRNPRIRFVRAPSDTHLLRMLASGRVDYILINTMPAYYRLRSMPDAAGRVRKAGAFALDGFHVAFAPEPPGGPALAAQFERGLQQLRASGEYDQIMTRFRRSLGLAH